MLQNNILDNRINITIELAVSQLDHLSQVSESDIICNIDVTATTANILCKQILFGTENSRKDEVKFAEDSL